MGAINLTDIIDDIFLNCSGDITKFWAKELAKQCALEFGKQLLELAAKNTRVLPCTYSDLRFDHAKIHSQSILDTIKQVK